MPAIRLSHLTEWQRTAFLIADNCLTDNSSWDERMLGEQLKILSELELDFDLVAIGFEVPEIDLLIDGLNTVPEADPDDHSPEIAESPITVAGDLWQLGKHRVRSALQCGHYGHVTGLGKVRHREFGMASGEMNSAEFTDFLRKAMTTAPPALLPRSPAVVPLPQSRTHPPQSQLPAPRLASSPSPSQQPIQREAIPLHQHPVHNPPSGSFRSGPSPLPHPQGSSASRECSLFATSEVMGTTSTRKRKGRFLFRDLAPCFPIFEDPVRDPDHN